MAWEVNLLLTLSHFEIVLRGLIQALRSSAFSIDWCSSSAPSAAAIVLYTAILLQIKLNYKIESHELQKLYLPNRFQKRNSKHVVTDFINIPLLIHDILPETYALGLCIQISMQKVWW